MNKYLLVLLAVLGVVLGSSWYAIAAAPGFINQFDAVCDPNFPTHCAAPDSSGNLPITGTISASSSTKSTAADPTYSEGSTTSPFSTNLTGGLRVGGGTAGSPDANAVTVQGAPSMTPVLTNPGTAANIGVGATGSAVPANAIYDGFNTGGNLTGSIKCQSSAVYDASTNGSTQLVALSAGKVVYVCGFNIVASGTVNVKLIYGTGTACVTSPGNITPAYQLTAQAGLVDDPGVYQGLNAIASNELCINTSAGVAVQAIVYYTQF